MKKLASTFPNMLLSLTLICLLVGAILGVMKSVTDEPIAKTELSNKIAAIEKVVPEFDNNPLDEVLEYKEGEKDVVKVYVAKKAGEAVGYAVETFTKNGFGGRIDLMVGFDAKGVICDFSVLKHGETPGLGAKMDEWFHTDAKGGNIQNMKGVDMAAENGTLVVAKDGGKVDAITASTITSRAFLDAVNRAYKYYLKAAGGASAGAEATDAAAATPQDEASTAAETTSTEENAAPAEKGDNK